ncbi:MAG: DAK2 domain-containing protein [Acutalibacteraceae bacterium]
MINGLSLKNALISAANNIMRQKSEINDLNIFPVPDGDTGTNMSLTIQAAVTALEPITSTSVSDILKIAASAMLRGARGNSGVILSLLFRGIADSTTELNELDGAALANALSVGVEKAYGAVMNPTEGTILTVARCACEAAQAAAEVDKDPIIVLSAISAAADEALKQTPEQLPVLKKAGVVDAGGKGLCVIFDGMVSLLRDGIMIDADMPKDFGNTADDEFFKKAAIEFDDNITYTYCTEFIIGKSKSCNESPAELRTALEKIGDCVVVAEDSDIIKTHVHTEHPGEAMELALKYGELLTVKVENMKEQNRKKAAENKAAENAAKKEHLSPVEPTEEIGFVAVATGEGLSDLFRDLGCNQIVSGGQSMNPSTEDIYQAIMATPAKTVFVFPNNKNIIMAAEQAVPLVKDREVIIIPTRTIPQGLTALLSYDADATAELNHEVMLQAMKNVQTGQVTYAARNSEFGATKIREGEIIALENGKLKLREKDPVKAAVKLTKEMVTRETAFITLIYGEDINEEQASQALEAIQSKVSDNIEITLVNGGQPIYYFIISVE